MNHFFLWPLPLLIALLSGNGCLVHSEEPPFRVEESDEALTIKAGEVPLLVYHKAAVPPPEGVDPVFTRSGFIHPVNTLSGSLVTGIHPADHYHHLGLWHAWVKCHHRGKDVDFWNLKAKTGTVRYAKTLAVTNEKDSAGFSVKQEHVSFVGSGDDRGEVVLEETLTLLARRSVDGWQFDYVFEQTNISDSPLECPAYRYGGGIGYRGPESWGKENSDYLTSEGFNRTNSHGTRAKWVMMAGPSGDSNENSSIVIFSHPDNVDGPQKIRTWDDGKIFFNYVPVQETGITIKPGEKVLAKYRVFVADGKPSVEQINELMRAYERG